MLGARASGPCLARGGVGLAWRAGVGLAWYQPKPSLGPPPPRETKRSKGIAYVLFQIPEDAVKAHAALDMTSFQVPSGRDVNVGVTLLPYVLLSFPPSDPLPSLVDTSSMSLPRRGPGTSAAHPSRQETPSRPHGDGGIDGGGRRRLQVRSGSRSRSRSVPLIPTEISLSTRAGRSVKRRRRRTRGTAAHGTRCS